MTTTPRQIAKVRGPLGELVKDLKGGLKSRKAHPNRPRPSAPTTQHRRESGGLVKVGSAMRKSLSRGFLGSNSSPDLLGEAAAQGASSCAAWRGVAVLWRALCGRRLAWLLLLLLSPAISKCRV